jgi:Uma2 family endonuclease
LEDSAEGFGGLVLGAPLDLQLFDHSVVQPDLMVFSAQSRHRVRDRVEVVPELVIEILSPGAVRQDRGEKLRLYGESGIREYWLVDPVERQIDFLVLRQGRYSIALPAGLHYRSPTLEGLSLDLEALWSRVDAKLGQPGS